MRARVSPCLEILTNRVPKFKSFQQPFLSSEESEGLSPSWKCFWVWPSWLLSSSWDPWASLARSRATGEVRERSPVTSPLFALCPCHLMAQGKSQAGPSGEREVHLPLGEQMLPSSKAEGAVSPHPRGLFCCCFSVHSRKSSRPFSLTWGPGLDQARKSFWRMRHGEGRPWRGPVGGAWVSRRVSLAGGRGKAERGFLRQRPACLPHYPCLQGLVKLGRSRGLPSPSLTMPERAWQHGPPCRAPGSVPLAKAHKELPRAGERVTFSATGQG